MAESLVPIDQHQASSTAKAAAAYLRREVRRGTSVWSRVGTAAENRAVRALRRPASCRWAARNQQLMGLDAADLGARLLIA
jgi:hypothetical protein